MVRENHVVDLRLTIQAIAERILIVLGLLVAILVLGRVLQIFRRLPRVFEDLAEQAHHVVALKILFDLINLSQHLRIQ